MKISERITELSQKHAGISEKISEWMLSNLKPVAYEFHGELTCTECGHKFQSSQMDIDGTIVCPECGKRLTVEHTTKKLYNNSCFMMITENIEDYQVFRYFWVEKNMSNTGTWQGCFEVLQKWLSKDGSCQYMCRRVKMFTAFLKNPYNLESDLHFRKKKNSNYYG